jgi:Kef-type K+ transport system membrane component KefB
MFYLIISFFSIGLFFYILKVAFWWFPEIKTFLMPHFDIKDQDVRLSFAMFFIFISFMLVLDLELVLGAFMAGVFINFFFEHKKELPKKLSSFGFGLLVPIFFIHIGSTLDLEILFEPDIAIKSLFVVGVMIGIRILASAVFIKVLKPKDIIVFALSQSMPLTLMIAIATLAYQVKSIDLFHYYVFVVGSVLEVVVSLLAIKGIYKMTSLIKTR